MPAPCRRLRQRCCIWLDKDAMLATPSPRLRLPTPLGTAGALWLWPKLVSRRTGDLWLLVATEVARISSSWLAGRRG